MLGVHIISPLYFLMKVFVKKLPGIKIFELEIFTHKENDRFYVNFVICLKYGFL